MRSDVQGALGYPVMTPSVSVQTVGMRSRGARIILSSCGRWEPVQCVRTFEGHERYPVEDPYVSVQTVGMRSRAARIRLSSYWDVESGQLRSDVRGTPVELGQVRLFQSRRSVCALGER
jgi:hypothetical protein